MQTLERTFLTGLIRKPRMYDLRHTRPGHAHNHTPLPQVKTHVHPVTGCTVPYVPMGRFIHVPPPCPRSDWANNFGKPWWRNEAYCVGILSEKTRWIRVINTLTLQEQAIEVVIL